MRTICKDASKRDLLNELMEARQLVWEYKTEASKVKQTLKKAVLEGAGTADVADVVGVVIKEKHVVVV